MNVRDAILKAADHIEANPGDFNFMATHSPTQCGTPGCALGWIGYFAGMRDVGYCRVSSGLLGVEAPMRYGHNSFEKRMDSMDGSVDHRDSWRRNAPVCARTLRAYADKYHPEQYPQIRDELTRIFNKEPAWTAS